MPPGSYFAYVLDPSGGHTPGFAGAPTSVTVATAGLIDRDASLAPSRGAVIGKVTEDPGGDPIAGAWALALTAGGAPETAVEADGDGNYTLDDLPAANHYIGWVDPTGAHPARITPNSPNDPHATPLTVTAGGETEANGTLPTQTTTGTGAALTGTVTDTTTGAPLPDVLVVAMHAADYRLARATPTDANGTYSLDLQTGSYKLVFLPTDARHAMEWHDNQPYFNIAGATNVTAPGTTNATLTPTGGTITGTVTAADTGRGLPAAWVFAIASNGTLTGTLTRPDGGYTLTDLAPGTYRVTYVDPVGGRPQEYHDNSATYDGATPLNITAATTTNGINATLG